MSGAIAKSAASNLHADFGEPLSDIQPHKNIDAAAQHTHLSRGCDALCSNQVVGVRVSPGAHLKHRSTGTRFMEAKTMDGRETKLTQDMLGDVKLRLRGPVLDPDDPGCEESRTVWNAMIDKKPGVITRCLGSADVIESVRFARVHNLLLCIKGGGHNIAGRAVADGALMLDLSLMRGA
jgi:hypothetical protein